VERALLNTARAMARKAVRMLNWFGKRPVIEVLDPEHMARQSNNTGGYDGSQTKCALR
jgi:hypothetical protein